MDLGLIDHVAIVTGGSRGIGRAIALALAAESVRVAICARTEGPLREVEAELGKHGEALAIAADVTEAADVERVVSETVDRFGQLDILVNCAGTRGREDTDEIWNATYASNLLGAARMTRAALPHLRASGHGSVVHITSIYGRESGGPISYNAIKSAMNAHAKALALELAPDVRVNAVAPGSVAFPGGSWGRRLEEDPEGMAKFIEDNIPMGRFGTPEEIANVVVFLCSDQANWVTGACINVDGGQSRSNI